MRTGFRRRRQPRPRRRKAWILVCLGKGGKFMIKLCETVTIFKTNLYHLLCLSFVSLLSPLWRVFLFLFSLFYFSFILIFSFSCFLYIDLIIIIIHELTSYLFICMNSVKFGLRDWRPWIISITCRTRSALLNRGML